jgi:hypothetical protein
VNRKPALRFIFITLFLDILGIGLIIPILPKLIENLELSFCSILPTRRCPAPGCFTPATGLFGYFISPQAPIHVPGMAFFLGSLLILCALLLALRSFCKTPVD